MVLQVILTRKTTSSVKIFIWTEMKTLKRINMPFQSSSPSLCIKTRLSGQPLWWKWVFILMQIKLISTRKVVHLASFWKWGFFELRSGLITRHSVRRRHGIHVIRSQSSKLEKLNFFTWPDLAFGFVNKRSGHKISNLNLAYFLKQC